MTHHQERFAALYANTAAGLLARSAARQGDKRALIFPDEQATYAELMTRADQIARTLLALDVQRGEHVGILMVNSVDNVAAIFACGLADCVAVPVNTRFRAGEVRNLILDSGVRVLLTSQTPIDRVDRVRLILDALESVDPAPEIITVELGADHDAASYGRTAAAELASSVPADSVADRACGTRSGDPGLIIYTSGTTSFPKGVVLSHEAFLLWGVTMAARFRLTAEDRLWDAKPFFHSGGLAGLLSTLFVGGTYYNMPFFDTAAALTQLRDARCTVAWPVYETIWMRILHHPSFTADAVASIRAVGLVGSPELLTAAQRKVPHAAVTSSYGSTECNPAAFATPFDPEKIRLNTVGRRAPGVELRVVDPETLRDVAPGVIGELIYQGPTKFVGYHNDAELTSSKVGDGGWYRSGDLGSIDAEGWVRYSGRLKDMLKVGGENVAAAEIEGALVSHPAVSVAAVVGAPDSDYGEVAAAFVELKPGSTVETAELIAWCESRIARFKVPRHVRYVTQWPMSATKIKKADLRTLIADELAAEAAMGSTSGSAADT